METFIIWSLLPDISVVFSVLVCCYSILLLDVGKSEPTLVECIKRHEILWVKSLGRTWRVRLSLSHWASSRKTGKPVVCNHHHLWLVLGWRWPPNWSQSSYAGCSVWLRIAQHGSRVPRVPGGCPLSANLWRTSCSETHRWKLPGLIWPSLRSPLATSEPPRPALI